MEKVLFTRESQGEFTGIYAKIEGGRLTITRQDLGEFEKEYSKDGEVESYLFLDEANTKRLMNALQATSEEELLVILKKRFKKYGSGINREIQNFCDKHGINYQTQTYY